MANFDLSTLLGFKPPRYLCKKCLAILTSAPVATKQVHPACTACKVTYEPTDEYTSYQVEEYLAVQGLEIKFADALSHGRSLATIARTLKHGNYPGDTPAPPLRVLLRALRTAKHFVHFSTFGLSHLLLGALKIVAQQVPVRGIVSNADASLLSELKDFTGEAPKLETKVYGTEANWRDMPHQKLIVIDGLLAFKGSANFTLNAWRKAASGREIVEVVTEVEDVIALNNEFFSPVWSELSDLGQSIQMTIGF